MARLKPKIGIIGGSGLYDIEGLGAKETVSISTPFGRPSDNFLLGELSSIEVAFLARHAAGHRISPSDINYRANIYGFKVLGVEKIISISAVGSFKAELRPLDIVVIDQFVDRTNQARKMTFFEKGLVAHVSFAEPVCQHLRKILYSTGKELGLRIHNGGTYLNMEGPAFSTRAESLLYKSWGMDVIGMTNMAEARLAREAEICYAALAMITDYDCWYQAADIESVTVEMIVRNLLKNAENAKKLIRAVLPKTADIGKTECECQRALKDAVITQKNLIPSSLKRKLKPIIGRYL